MEENKTYTQEEVDALLQKEGDRRVSEALKKQEKKNEAEKLALMNEQEKHEYELKKREEDILKREKELSLMECKNTASRILSEKGLSLDLVDFIVSEDAEKTKKNIDKLEKAFNACVQSEVNRRIGGSQPKSGVNAELTNITKQDFAKMTISQQNELLKTNPDLYNMLIK